MPKIPIFWAFLMVFVDAKKFLTSGVIIARNLKKAKPFYLKNKF